MTLFVCVDDDMGVLFNRRRQSKDRVLRARMLSLAKGHILYVSSFTAKQFEEGEEGYTVCDFYEKKAKKGDFIFAEDHEIFLEGVTRLILYRWNRSYPADRFFRFDAEKEGFVLLETTDFVGSSHDKITEEIYLKK